MAHCSSGRSCVLWMEKYLKDSVCGVRDYVSLCFGLISILSWAAAEIPQIVTNFNSGSTEGVSFAFVMAWVVGDVFNLMGCLLVPTTLPTQFYTALLYTINSVVLVLQSLYYGHIYRWWKAWKWESSPMDCASKNMPEHTESVNVPENIKSARSLASSPTPIPGSYISSSSHGSGRSGPSFTLNQPSLDDEGFLANNDSEIPKNSRRTLCSIAATVFVVGGLNYFNLEADNSFEIFDSTKVDSRASVLLTGRKVLQEASTITLSYAMIGEEPTSMVGTSLGWIMAALYIAGSISQIWKNVKRGTVEGLNPMMFMFAVVGDGAYVASILVRSLEWKNLKSNMPWLVDAAVCVLLDCFILTQFNYCKRRRPDGHQEDINGDYEEINP